MSIFDDIREQGLNDATMAKLKELFGNRAEKAADAARKGRVKKYRDFYVVKGNGDEEYVIEEGFCMCRDYFIRRMKNSDVCYHTIAVRIAEALGKVEIIDEWYVDKIIEKMG